jgi:Domain of Unknown Function (DUF1080)
MRHKETTMSKLISTWGVVLATSLGLLGCASAPSGGGSADAGWVTLIDGAQGLDNFNRIGSANWRALDGAIQADARADQANAFLMTKQTYTDFQIRVEFWSSDDANSGIYMRCANVFNVTDRTCYEANIFDRRPDPKYGTGAIVHLAAITNMPKAGGKWNVYDITAKGSKLTVTLNGQRTVELDDKTLDAGPIGLQYAGGTMKFRKVQIRRL